MRIVVFGASGRIGSMVVKQGLVQGHQVTAVVREAGRLDVRADRLDVVVADPFDVEAVAKVVAGHDAVLSALGPRAGGRSDVCGRAATTITEAMRRAGVVRLLVVSASGPFVDGGDDPLTRFVVKPIVQRILRESFADLVAAEKTVRGSGLEWTIVRPSRLTDKPATGRERRSLDRNLSFGMFTPRAAVAGEMLRNLDDPATVGHTIALAR
ncbi:NAD(P)-dependent oxidoreductase [Paractinoplanes atraurantiacus]|uniref:Putative NADH-flavin reductase n=1 Tax=Paractinoplanes atraurantiacus TaxID=1036182 RepID=A0A285K1L1_9ACTN|nr:NAD(P)H-binding protein [Actinoplanes atraurantiacus]SNY65221.1 Putative NADH-flavin reductase [Actinoplanes atraurantiacus]